MSDQQIVDTCEKLWELATKDKKPVSSCEADRQRDETYVSGFRNDIQSWTYDQGGFVIRAKKVDWKTFDLAADRSGKRRTLEILHGGEFVFKATQEGATVTKKFGAEERYIGTDQTPENPWTINKGTIPSELERVSA